MAMGNVSERERDVTDTLGCRYDYGLVSKNVEERKKKNGKKRVLVSATNGDSSVLSLLWLYPISFISVNYSNRMACPYHIHPIQK
jgi:hypothetical protein